MKIIGIQIKSKEAVLVVLEKDANDNISQTEESAKFKIDDPSDAGQVRQFRDQINSAFDSIGADRIGVIARMAKGGGKLAASPISFKLEGIMQLYEKTEIELIWKQTTNAYFKKNPKPDSANHNYQQDAYNLATYMIR